MSRALRSGVVSVALLLAVAVPASAQVQQLPLHLEESDVEGHPEVVLTVGMPPELVGIEIPAEAFTVTENGIAADTSVTPVPSDDLEVVLVLDVSGSMAGEPLAAAQAAALSFIDQMPPGVRVAVVTFSDETTVASTFSADPESTLNAIADLSTQGETALYDGLVIAAEQFDLDAPARRTLVLLSDGGDTVSENSLERALVGMLDADVSFYAIELQTPENDPAALTRLAAATDGAVVAATDPEALQGIFEEIAAQLTNRYQLTYLSEAFGSSEVVVSVEAEGFSATTRESLRLPAAPEPPAEVAEPVEPVVEPVQATTRPGALVQLSLFEQPVALYLGAVLILVALAAILFAASGVERKRKNVLRPEERTVATPSGPVSNPALGAVADRAIGLAERSLGSERGGRVNLILEQAGISMRPAEFVVVAVIAAVVGLAGGYVLLGFPWAIGGALIALVGVRWYVSRKAEQRKAAFAEQLPDTLHLMAGSLRAGFGLLQAVDVVAGEAPEPTSEEFQRVKVEVHLGRDMDEALHAMAKRVGSEDFEWVTEAIAIHREVGGDIAEIIDSVNATIRSRNQIRRRIRSLSAEGRVSAVVLVALPLVLAVLIAIGNPDYLAELTTSTVGRLMIGFALVAMVVGVIWIRRIIRLEF